MLPRRYGRVLRVYASVYRIRRKCHTFRHERRRCADSARAIKGKMNAARPAPEQLTLIRIFEELRGRGYDSGLRCGAALRQAVEQRTRAIDRGRLCPAELCTRPSLLVRLVTTRWSCRARVRLWHSRMFVRPFRGRRRRVFDARYRVFAPPISRRRMAQSVRRRQNDHCAARSVDPSVRHRRDHQ